MSTFQSAWTNLIASDACGKPLLDVDEILVEAHLDF
jgi:hypothetical protein